MFQVYFKKVDILQPEYPFEYKRIKRSILCKQTKVKAMMKSVSMLLRIVLIFLTKPILHIVRLSLAIQALMFFHFNVFLKRFDMLSQWLILSITKKVIFYLLVLEQQPPLIALQVQNFH